MARFPTFRSRAVLPQATGRVKFVAQNFCTKRDIREPARLSPSPSGAIRVHPRRLGGGHFVRRYGGGGIAASRLRGAAADSAA